MTHCSLLVINYRSAVLALEAIGTARAAAALPLQVVVVDNSVDAREAEALRGAADVLVVSSSNLGYAGGINAGRRACDGEIIIVSNPDVRFGAGAVDRLIEADAAVAGPALFWDDAFEWLLPPGDLHTTWDVLSRAVASRSRVWALRRDRRRVLARLAFWSLQRPTKLRALSGAVMAIRASAFDAAGGFDEQFPLYFEENDFLRRVRGDVVYAPAARCRHLYNQSAAGSVEAATAYGRSEMRYLRKWSGWPGVVAKRLERPRKPLFEEALPIQGPITIDRDDLVIEASPLPTFETAAGYVPKRRSVIVPPEVRSAYRGNLFYLRSVERETGRMIAVWVVRVSS